jgi:hypothetical protein
LSHAQPDQSTFVNLSLTQPSDRSSSQLPIQCSTYYLDQSISDSHIQHLRQVIQSGHHQNDQPIISMLGHRITTTFWSSFQQLLTYNSPNNDSIIHTFLSVVCSNHADICALDTNFHRDLCTQGWQRAYSKFFLLTIAPILPVAFAQNQLDTPTILIPIHINGSHWVAVVCCQINEKVFFCTQMILTHHIPWTLYNLYTPLNSLCANFIHTTLHGLIV